MLKSNWQCDACNADRMKTAPYRHLVDLFCTLFHLHVCDFIYKLCLCAGKLEVYMLHCKVCLYVSEAGFGNIAGILSGIGVALVGAAAGYFTYQKKKLCFKAQGGL